MAEGAGQIPDKAVEELRLELVGLGWANANARAVIGHVGRKPTEQEWNDAWASIHQDLRSALQAAYPHLLAAFSEELLGDEAVKSATNAALALPDDGSEDFTVVTRVAIRAALATLNVSGGDRG